MFSARVIIKTMIGHESFAGELFRKYAAVKLIETRTEVVTRAAEQEVLRQVKQVSLINGGNPITGEGVTKSGLGD